MCTNYVPTRGQRLTDHFDIPPPKHDFRDEAFPGYLAPIIRRSSGGLECVPAIFGLIPAWSKDGRNYRFCYNARSETVSEKPSFRNAWKKRQLALVPADAFFEPHYETGRAVRWRIERTDQQPMALAGIWEIWRKPATSTQALGPKDARLFDNEWVTSFSLLTVHASHDPVMRQFHPLNDEKRSVILIPADQQQDWLACDPQQALSWFKTAPDGVLQAHPAPQKPRKSSAKAIPNPTPKLL